MSEKSKYRLMIFFSVAMAVLVLVWSLSDTVATVAEIQRLRDENAGLKAACGEVE
jgi:hypothetical protein